VPRSRHIGILDPILKVDGLSRDEVRDDRGVIVKMASVRDIAASRLYRVPELRPTIAQLTPIRLPHQRDFSLHIRNSIILALIACVAGVGVYFISSFGPAFITFFGVAFGGGILNALRIRYRETDAEVRTLYVRAVTRATLCPTCLYDLLGLDPDETGMVTCSECGSCWDSDRFERTEPARIPDDDESLASLGEKYSASGRIGAKSAQDETGQWFSLANPRFRSIKKRHTDPEHQTRIRAAAKRSRKSGRVVRAAAVLGMLLYMAALATSGTPGMLPGLAGMTWGAFLQGLVRVIFVLVYVMFAIRLWFGRIGVKPERIIRDALEQGLCPACWADLGDMSADQESQANPCAACGAVWR